MITDLLWHPVVPIVTEAYNQIHSGTQHSIKDLEQGVAAATGVLMIMEAYKLDHWLHPI